MQKMIRTTIVLALTILTQAASSQELGQFDQTLPNAEQTQDMGLLQRDPRDPRDPRNPGDPRNPRDELTYISLGEARTRKVVNNEFIFRGQGNIQVYRLRIVGTGASVIIRAVEVTFRNGQRVNIRQLEGPLRQGERIGANINGRVIDEIRVVATSDSLVGSRGRFRVDVGIYRY